MVKKKSLLKKKKDEVKGKDKANIKSILEKFIQYSLSRTVLSVFTIDSVQTESQQGE